MASDTRSSKQMHRESPAILLDLLPRKQRPFRLRICRRLVEDVATHSGKDRTK